MNPHVSLTHAPQTINPGPIPRHLHLHPLPHPYIILQQIPSVVYFQLYPGLNNRTIRWKNLTFQKEKGKCKVVQIKIIFLQ